jgi:hypothetical protein
MEDKPLAANEMVLMESILDIRNGKTPYVVVSFPTPFHLGRTITVAGAMGVDSSLQEVKSGRIEVRFSGR